MWQAVVVIVMAYAASSAYGIGCGRDMALYNVTVDDMLNGVTLPNGHVVSGEAVQHCEWDVRERVIGISLIQQGSGTNRWKGAKLIHYQESRFDRWVVDINIGQPLIRTYIPIFEFGEYDLVFFDRDLPDLTDVATFCISNDEVDLLDRHTYDFVYETDLGGPHPPMMEIDTLPAY